MRSPALRDFAFCYEDRKAADFPMEYIYEFD